VGGPDTSDGDVIVWDVKKREEKQRLAGFKKWIYVLGFLPHDNNRLLIRPQTGPTEIWDLDRAIAIKTFDISCFGSPRATISPTGTLLASADWDIVAAGADKASTMVALVNLKTDHKTILISGAEGGIPALSFSPDGQMLAMAVGRTTGRLMLFDVENAQ